MSRCIMLGSLILIAALILALSPQIRSLDYRQDPTITDPRINDMLSNVSLKNIYSTVFDLQNFTTRQCYSQNCLNSSVYLLDKFKNITGLSVSFDTFEYNGHSMRNVIALLNGTDPTAKWCVICAHYDSRSSDPENPVESAPGADDDASGIAGVIEAAAVLSPYKFKSTIAFVALSGEGVGCQGSKHYAINATSNHMNISCVVDLDMIGYDPLNLSRLVVADYYDSLDIFKDMKAYNIDYSIGLQLEENTLGYANTDYRSFSAEGFPALMCIEKHFNPEHHLPTDTIDQLNPTFMTKVVSLTIATVASYAMVDYLVPSGETVAFVIVCSGINLIACAWIVGRLASEN